MRVLRLGLVGALAALACAVPGAVAAPALGRWEAQGSGGARLVFMVVGAGPRRYVAHLASFCGDRGAPELDDWTGVPGRPIVDETDVAKLSSGRFRTDFRSAPTLAGRLGERSGDVHANPRRLLGTFGITCSAADYASLRARWTGPAPVPDGVWQLLVPDIATGGFTTSEIRTYGGGSLVQWYGTFPGKPSPKYPTVPCEPIVISASTPMHGTRLRANYADSFGATTAASLTGAFSSTHAAGVYTSAFQYHDLVCYGVGVWMAGPVRRPVYRLPPARPGGQPPGHVRVPVRTPPKGPRAGPEPTSFHCDYPKPDGPYDPCRLYTRRENGQVQLIWLRHGEAGARGWGYRKIAAKRGFSPKTDRYIAETLTGGKPVDDDPGVYVRTYRGHGRSCRYRVVTGAASKGIVSAYREESSKQGNVSGCP